MTGRLPKCEAVILAALVAAALTVRLAFLEYPGYKFDMDLFVAWGELIRVNGLLSIYEVALPPFGIANHPPVFMYLLWGMGKFFGIVTPVLIKTLILVLDLAAGIFVWFWLRAKSLEIRIAAALAVFLGPSLILVSGFWGQTDIIYSLFVVLAFAALAGGRFSLAAALGVAAVFAKVQAAVFLPLIAGVILTRRASIFRPLLAAVGVGLALSAPFIFGGQTVGLAHPFVKIFGQYGFLTVRSFNFWWPISRGELVPDAISILGVPAAALGIALVAAALLWTLYFLRFARERGDIMFAGAFAALTFFFFATQMHERYLFPVFLFLPLAFERYRGVAAGLWFMLTASFAANLFYVLRFGALSEVEFDGALRLVLIDSWWLVNAAVVVIMAAVMHRRISKV